MTEISERRWDCSIPGDVLTNVQKGVFLTRYRDRALVKSPFDIMLYIQLIGRIRPMSIIEIGSCDGGSAFWLHDTAKAHDLDVMVVSIDLKPPRASDAHPKVRFIAGDARALGGALTDELLASLPKPWLVTEDSAHDEATCAAVLHFFDLRLEKGDYVVIEDGVVQFLPEEKYRRYDNGPNKAVTAFLTERGDDYDVDATLCDLYGYNATYNPNGWLKRL